MSGSRAHMTSRSTRHIAVRVKSSQSLSLTGSLQVVLRKEHKSHSKGTPMRWSPSLAQRYLFLVYARSTSRSEPLWRSSSLGKLLFIYSQKHFPQQTALHGGKLPRINKKFPHKSL
jgi:hypothetical protein